MAAADIGWKVVGIGSGVVASRVAKAVVAKTWTKARKTDPPRNPAAPETTWPEAVSFAVVSGVALGVSKMLATRGAAAGWKRATGALPPGLETTGA